MTSLWRKNEIGKWTEAEKSGFPKEEEIEEIIFSSPSILPLGGVLITPLRRQFPLAKGRPDIMAVEATGRPVIIEVKLATNPESRRAILGQVLAYAAYLEKMSRREFANLATNGLVTDGDLREVIHTPAPEYLNDAVDWHLANGVFRLVLVLDEVTDELLRAASYLHFATTTKVWIDLIELQSFIIQGEQVIVPRAVELMMEPEAAAVRAGATSVLREEGTELFRASLASLDVGLPELVSLADWADHLAGKQKARPVSAKGALRTVLTVRLMDSDSGLLSVWNEPLHPVLVIHGTVLAERAPTTAPRIAALLPPDALARKMVRIGDPAVWSALIILLTDAYDEAAGDSGGT